MGNWYREIRFTPLGEPEERRWRWFWLRSLFTAIGAFCVLLFVNTRPSSPVPIGHVSTLDRSSVILPGMWIDGCQYGWPWPYEAESVARLGDFHVYYFGDSLAMFLSA